MSAAKQRDGASILGMVWVSRFVNHTQNKPPYKEGVSCIVSGRQVAVTDKVE